jgi:gluconolactonase
MNPAESRNLIAPGAVLTKAAGGFSFTEGPTPDAAGNVYFTDQPNDRILVYDVAGRLSTYLQPAGRANGMSFDREGTLFMCADEKNELWSLDKNKSRTILVSSYQGKLLNGPNDVWVHPDGSLYFTDPYYQRPYWQRGPKEQSCEGVYRLSPDRNILVRLIDDLVQPNGIVGTPDGKTLYVADIAAQKTFSYTVDADGGLSGKKLHCAVGSDGMTIDELGNLYLTGQGVTVVGADGKTIMKIPVPESWTANVCFGGKDMKTLFITASESLYSLRMQVRGIE